MRFLLACCVLLLGCPKNDCDERRAAGFAPANWSCKASVCRASVTAAEARRLTTGGYPLPASMAGTFGTCSDVASRRDARGQIAVAMSDPCCSWGGSACTMTYSWMVSEEAGAACVALK